MYKVVIVDDEDIIVTGLSRLLPWEQYGCELAGTANNGREALALAQKVNPDIMFTDIRMPEMDGLSLIAALKSEHPDMEVSILSGHPDFEYAQRAIGLGVCRYILKPSKMNELEEALARMVEKLDERKKQPLKANKTTPQSGKGEQAGEQPEKDPDAAGNFIIKNAIKYIEENYAEKLTLPEVSEQVYVSQWHLSKLIARNTGQSFSDLLNGVRINKAKELLKDPSLKIWEVSEMVGFSDVTHFSRIFKKLENQSANEYRNNLKD